MQQKKEHDAAETATGVNSLSPIIVQPENGLAYMISRIPGIRYWGSAALCCFIVLIDIPLPLDIAVGVFYIPLLFCSLWFRQARAVFAFAAIASALVVFAALLKPPGEISVSAVIANRTFAIATLWIVAALLYLRGKSETARRTIMQQTKQDAIYLNAVLNTIIDGLITIDDRGIIQSLNPAAESMFGYRPEEAIGRNVKMLMPEPYHGEHDGYLKNYLRTGSAKIIGIRREVSAKRKDGSVFAMELAVNEMRVGDERLFVGTTRDISARKTAETNLKRALGQLKQSNDELEAFAYIASHDLKEPLRGLANNATILKEDFGETLDIGVHKRLNRMVYLCQRMERLVDDLLYFSRLGRQDLAIQPADLNAIIKDIESMMESTLHEKNARIVVSSPLPVVVCDVPRITEVFRNLITNAVKYNDSLEKRVEIGCKNGGGGEQVFYVRDNGIGIARDFYDDIFRIFKRLNEEDDSVKGTGVGLTFVKKIVERHGGRIWLESAPGEGTTFYFTLNTIAKGESDERLAAYSAG